MYLVAVHGHPLDHRLFDPLSRLASAGALGPGTVLVARDLRGRGASRRPAAPVHSMTLLADDLLEEVEAEVPASERLLLLGVSMGGYVLLELLRRHGRRLGSRVAALALVGSRANADDEAGRAARHEAVRALREEGIEASLRSMLPRLLSPRSRGSEAERLTREMVLATPAATAIADQLGMAERADGLDVLGELGRPFLAVVGEDDLLTPSPFAEAMVEAAAPCPFVRLLTLPGAGHLAVLEAPGEIAAALADLASRAR